MGLFILYSYSEPSTWDAQAILNSVVFCSSYSFIDLEGECIVKVRVPLL